MSRIRLYLVRHAHAAPGSPDELRPISPEGRDQARALGRRLAADSVRPNAILTSPLLRARETGELLGRALDCDPAADERLAPGATVEDVRAAVSGRGETVVVVAHQPDCGQIAAELGGREPSFPPAGFCALDLDT
jgi:phosphohistidine phosphatase